MEHVGESPECSPVLVVSNADEVDKFSAEEDSGDVPACGDSDAAAGVEENDSCVEPVDIDAEPSSNSGDTTGESCSAERGIEEDPLSNDVAAITDYINGREIIEISEDCENKLLGYKEVYYSAGLKENRLIVPVKVAEEHIFPALVDTGACRSLIHESVLKECNLEMKKVEGQYIKGFGSRSVLR